MFNLHCQYRIAIFTTLTVLGGFTLATFSSAEVFAQTFAQTSTNSSRCRDTEIQNTTESKETFSHRTIRCRRSRVAQHQRRSQTSISPDLQSDQVMEQQASPYKVGTTVVGSISTKPPVVCRIPIASYLVRWKCPKKADRNRQKSHNR
jgi:hypothetical protein